MPIYVDAPTWPGHGRFWSHLVSDTSYDELHAFAARLGVPPRAFERDDYVVVATRHADGVRLGGIVVGCKELVRRLIDSGLRRRKHAGARGLPSARPRGGTPPGPDAPRLGPGSASSG